MRIFRLAIDDSERPISSPIAADYENNWSFKS